MHCPLYPWGNSHDTQLNTRLSGIHSWSGQFREGNKNLSPLPGFKLWIVQPIVQSLYWSQHLDQIATKLCSACYALRNLKHIIPHSTLRTIYYACIRSILKESRNRPGVAQRVPGGLGFQIFISFGTWRWWGCHPHAPAAFTPRKCSWYSFSIGAESTPGPWNGRKEYVTEKSSDTTGNRSRDRPTSSTAP
jgi:hypothetical protein